MGTAWIGVLADGTEQVSELDAGAEGDGGDGDGGCGGVPILGHLYMMRTK
jgi:hypothetical protein